MEQKEGNVLIAASTVEKGEQISKLLSEARLLNGIHAVTDLSGVKRVFQEKTPRLILVDLSMPEAWKILDFVDASRDGCPYPVIVMINKKTERDLDRAYDAGACSYLNENFSFPEFLDRARFANLSFSIVRQ